MCSVSFYRNYYHYETPLEINPLNNKRFDQTMCSSLFLCNTFIWTPCTMVKHSWFPIGHFEIERGVTWRVQQTICLFCVLYKAGSDQVSCRNQKDAKTTLLYSSKSSGHANVIRLKNSLF